MIDYIFSFTLFAIPANLIVGLFYLMGKEKAGLLWYEYFFIYLPYVTLNILSWLFFDVTTGLDIEHTLKIFILVLQSVSAGVLGGFVLLPRFFYPAVTVSGKLRISLLSALVFSLVYALTRVLLFTAIRTLY